MMVAPIMGSSPSPYSVLPERTRVAEAPCELWNVTRRPVPTTVPDQVHAFEMLFDRLDGVTVAVNVPSSLI